VLANCNETATLERDAVSDGDFAELNITIRNVNGVANCATFSVETSVHGYKNVLALISKYLHPLAVCYDMGWQWHLSTSTGAYNSMSGHVFLVGANSNTILKRIVYSKSCCTCAR